MASHTQAESGETGWSGGDFGIWVGISMHHLADAALWGRSKPAELDSTQHNGQRHPKLNRETAGTSLFHLQSQRAHTSLFPGRPVIRDTDFLAPSWPMFLKRCAQFPNITGETRCGMGLGCGAGPVPG